MESQKQENLLRLATISTRREQMIGTSIGIALVCVTLFSLTKAAGMDYWGKNDLSIVNQMI